MKKTLCECSLQKRTKIIGIFYLVYIFCMLIVWSMINAYSPINFFFQLVNLATGFYRSYQLSLIEFVGIGVLPHPLFYCCIISNY